MNITSLLANLGIGHETTTATTSLRASASQRSYGGSQAVNSSSLQASPWSQSASSASICPVVWHASM